jgi:hypothetical protein
MYSSKEENKMNKNQNYRHFKNLTNPRGKWTQPFDEAKNQIMDLPNWAQGILIEVITTALQSRIIIMKNANKNIQAMQHR